MFGIRDYQTTVAGEAFAFVESVEKWGFTRRQLVESLPAFKRQMDALCMTVDDLMSELDEHRVMDRDLFEYTITATDFMVAKDGVYTEKWKKNEMVKTSYNVYINSSYYLGCVFNRLAEDWVIKKCPFLYDKAFTKEVFRFPETVRTMLPTDTKVSIDDALHGLSIEGKDLTIEDIINIYTVDGYRYDKVIKPDFSAYEGGDVFLNLGEKSGHCLHMTVRDLIDKNWDAICERKVYSIENGKTPDGKNIFYDGRQDEAPYFNCKKVERFKKLLLGK